MINRKKLIECFDDTIAFSKASLADETIESINSNTIIQENYVCCKKAKETDFGSIIVVEDSSFNVARQFSKMGKIAVLNFANPIEPGGGVTRGAMAQEECLCRSSNLYLCLNDKNVQEGFYQAHKNENSSLASDRLIYTKKYVYLKMMNLFRECLIEKNGSMLT